MVGGHGAKVEALLHNVQGELRSLNYLHKISCFVAYTTCSRGHQYVLLSNEILRGFEPPR